MFLLKRYRGYVLQRTLKQQPRRLLIGYRVTDFKELFNKELVTQRASIQIKNTLSKRHYVGAALPIFIENVCPYVPDNNSILGKLMSTFKRLLQLPPEIKNYQEQKSFVRSLLHSCLYHLSPSTDLSYKTFRNELPHPEWRKKQLDDASVKLPDLSPKRIAMIKSFIKREMFEEPKYPRTINARCDAAKVKYGPMIRAIEKCFYDEMGYFAKHIDVAERPKMIKTRFQRFEHIYCSDYSAFESHMTPQMMQICESQLYKFMMKHVPKGSKLATEYSAMLEGENTPQNKDLKVKVNGIRQSGEMSTSLGNGFTNMSLIIYMLWKKYGKPSLNDIKFWNSFDLLIEGDDALIGYNGQFELTEQDFASIGLTSKIEKHDSVETTRFCQIAFQCDDLENVGEIRRILKKTFFTIASGFKSQPHKLMKYMQAKARSLLYEFPACPIITSIGKCLLRNSVGTEPVWEDSWKHHPSLTEVNELLKTHKFTDRTRQFIARHQHISESTQKEIESIFDAIEKPGPINLDRFKLFNHKDYCTSLKFVETVRNGCKPNFD